MTEDQDNETLPSFMQDILRIYETFPQDLESNQSVLELLARNLSLTLRADSGNEYYVKPLEVVVDEEKRNVEFLVQVSDDHDMFNVNYRIDYNTNGKPRFWFSYKLPKRLAGVSIRSESGFETHKPEFLYSHLLSDLIEIGKKSNGKNW